MVVSLPLKKNVCVGKPADEIGPGVVKKTKTHDENEDPWRKRRHITCKLIHQWAAFPQKREAVGPLFGPRTPRGRNRVHRKFEEGTSKLLIGHDYSWNVTQISFRKH